MVSIGSNPGMSFVSSTFSRVSSVLSRNVFLGNMRSNQEDMLRIQEQLSTGRSILRPSDDPVGAHKVLDFNLRISRDDQYIRNLDAGTARLTVSDGTTENANEILNRAREILLQQVQSTATTQTREAAANEISTLLEEAVSLGNTKMQGRHIYGGSRTESEPFVFVGGSVAFLGNTNEFKTDVADGLRLSTNIDPDKAFGVFSEGIEGLNLASGTTGYLQAVDLNPALRAETKLDSLNEGEGVRTGSLRITTSAGNAIVDLAGAENVGDILDRINEVSGTTGVTASIDNPVFGKALTLTDIGGGNITVEEVGGGLAAADLGIKVTNGASSFTGSDLDPNITSETEMGMLLSGVGIGTAGMTVSNVTATSSFSSTFDVGTFGSSVTVGEVLNQINNAGLFVDARISETGTGIDIFSRLSGGRLTISENGGSTASELGLLSTAARATLGNLNNGLGVGTVEGDDIRITKMDGSDLFLDVDESTTVQSLVDAIDADPGLTATLTALDEILITDTTSGTAGNLTIDNFNGSFAATNLGIVDSTSGQIVGIPLVFAGVQPVGVFTSLVQLRDSLLANDTVAINSSGSIIDESQKNLLETRAQAGSRLSSLELTKNRVLTEKLELERIVSGTRDIDFAAAATKFQVQQTVLESSLAVASRILQTSILSYL
ncbi:MAG: flagellar hook-associated protein FlgL [Planctomycetota bacterium]|nr:flagellar hook-associated protein FlgL [Planctomycetota bacterium]